VTLRYILGPEEEPTTVVDVAAEDAVYRSGFVGALWYNLV
jgi:hypothetical protein